MKRVLTLSVKTDSSKQKSFDVIELRSGQIFVEKDSALVSVTETIFEQPIAAFALQPGIGVTGLWVQDSGFRFRPMAKLSFVEFVGTYRLSLLADLDGVGGGAEWSFYHELAIGGGYFADYSNMGQRSFKLTLSYTF